MDCISLHEIIIKFRSLIFEHFSLDVLKYPTIPSLAFAVYRSKYMPEGKIPLTKGKVFNFMKESYTHPILKIFIF